MKILLAGGSGFIGRALKTELLRSGHSVAELSRRAGTPGTVFWDGRSPGPWTQELPRADAVINLSGEPVAGPRWTAERKRALLESRVGSTRALVQGLLSSGGPRILLNASGVGYYGDVPEGEVDETASQGSGFLAELSGRWEAEALAARKAGVRVALLRTGIVLGPGGGALEKMAAPFRFFAGGPLGSGRQWFPWIHREDEVGAIRFILERESISGPVNLASPHPVRLGEFCRELGRVLGRPSWLRVPAPVLRLVAGELADALLSGQKVLPGQLLRAGFVFRHPELRPALESIFKGSPKEAAA